MSTRHNLIIELTQLINSREGTTLTHKQVCNYIGSDMSNEKLSVWVEETHDLSDPVTAQDVLSLWDLDTNNEIIVGMINENSLSHHAEIKEFQEALTLNSIQVTGIGQHEGTSDSEDEDTESSCPYKILIAVGNYKIELNALLEWDGGWELTRKNFIVSKEETEIFKQGEFDTLNDSGWASLLEEMRIGIHNNILNNGEPNTLFDEEH